MKRTKFYILEENFSNGLIGVAYVAHSQQEANDEKSRREALYPDLYFWIEEGYSEPKCVTV